MLLVSPVKKEVNKTLVLKKQKLYRVFGGSQASTVIENQTRDVLTNFSN